METPNATHESSLGRFFGRRCFGGFGLAVAAPGDQEHQAHAGADGAVSHIEGGKADLGPIGALDEEIDEINLLFFRFAYASCR